MKLFDWIHELGGCKPRHELWLLHDARCNKDTVRAILASAQRSFEPPVGDVIASAEIDGWPEGANYMFRTIASTLAYTNHKYFMWMEPDAIPLKSGWLDEIEAEYLAGKKPFMGDRVEVNDIPLHMSGVGVYQNPVYQLAGEAYRAADIAWDMAARHQIVPNCHFTDLIEHAWKHPTFTNQEELQTQIDPKAVLFHASKDGSLIRILRQQKNLPVPVLAEPKSSSPENGMRIVGEARESISRPHHGDSRGGQTPIYDIFIRTYPVDYPWLQFCLRSINQYATGFRKIWIVSPEQSVGVNLSDWRGVEWKVLNEESKDGYLSQQIHKLYADVITDYEPDYILHIDSDTLFTRPVTPQDFFTQPLGSLDITHEPKLIWYFTPYEQTETPWKPITEKFMNMEVVEHEFMRRLPMMVPRFLYDSLRRYCFDTHKTILSDYVRRQPYREFSEFNALGAYAYYWEYDKDFEWINTLSVEMPDPFARQFYSWGGMTKEVKAEIQAILGGSVQNTRLGGNAEESKGIVVDSPNTISNGEDMTIGDHVRALAEYANNPSRRQYVLGLLGKVNLKQMRKGRKPKKKVKA